jgi:hypothetical protein
MHEPVKGRLEEYLGGDGPFPDVETHLRACEECRSELADMRVLSTAFQALKAEPNRELSPSFYAGVIERIAFQRPSVWELFAESLFARRLAYASAAFVLLLSAFLVSPAVDPQQSVVASSAPEFILSDHSEELPPPIEVQPEQRGVVLVNLASYNQDFQ